MLTIYVNFPFVSASSVHSSVFYHVKLIVALMVGLTLQVKAVAEEMGIGFIGLGFQPKWERKDIPIMPKVEIKSNSIFRSSNFRNSSPLIEVKWQ